MMYFKLNSQRSTILIGSAVMQSNKKSHDVEPDRSKGLVKAFEPLLRQQRRNQQEVSEHHNESKHLSNEWVFRQPCAETFHPDVFRKIHVHEGLEFVNIPELIRTKEVPVRTSQGTSQG